MCLHETLRSKWWGHESSEMFEPNCTGVCTQPARTFNRSKTECETLWNVSIRKMVKLQPMNHNIKSLTTQRRAAQTWSFWTLVSVVLSTTCTFSFTAALWFSNVSMLSYPGCKRFSVIEARLPASWVTAAGLSLLIQGASSVWRRKKSTRCDSTFR